MTSNIYQKLSEARKQLIGKVIKEKPANGLQYKIYSVEEVVSAVSQTCQNIGLFYYIEKMEAIFNGKETHILATMKIINIDNPSEYIVIQDVGSGMDNQDKASGKASSYVLKKCLMQVFALQDQEETDSASIPENGNNMKNTINKSQKAQSIEVFTSDEEFKNNLIKAGFTEKESYKSKGIKVMQSWIDPEKVSTIKERLKANAYSFNISAGYYEQF